MYYEDLESDWEEKHQKLKNKMRLFEDEYRKKHYSQLTDEQKVSRNYKIIDGKEFCDLMIKARTRQFRQELEEELLEFIKLQNTKKQEISIIQTGQQPQPDAGILSQRHIQRTYSA